MYLTPFFHTQPVTLLLNATITMRDSQCVLLIVLLLIGSHAIFHIFTIKYNRVIFHGELFSAVERIGI